MHIICQCGAASCLKVSLPYVRACVCVAVQVDFVSGLTRSQFEEVPGMGAKFDKMRQRLHKI
eukprot:COSAG06_NODE_22587_length_718_cov_10.368336_1_plen_61_part_01